jgi:hypothetical protein
MVHAGFLTASLLLLAGAALGQTPAQDSFEPDAAATWAQAFGLTRVAGALHAAGPSYAAEIAPGGITVIPVLGTSSARSSSLALALDSIWRGNTRILVAAKPEPAPEHDGLLVRVPRGEGIEERFAVQRDGVEHSFVFAHPLPGSGDLVVRLRADTELEPTPVGDELHFTRQGVSGVAIGAVTGIDADGRRAPGTLRHRAGHVEYRLPGWFVESARYPLVLDPVLGAPVTVRPLGTVPVADPDVAFDASTGTYLVVWAHGASAGAMAIQGQRVSATGALVGGLITIHPAAAGEVVGHPSVASVNTANRFVVAYEHTPPAGDITIRARAIDAASGAVSANSTLVSSQGGIGARRPDLGGRSGAGVIALVAWETVTTSEIRARTLIVSSGPVVQPPAVSGSEVTVASAAGIDEHNPAVCRHDAGTGNYLVVWERVTSSSTLVGGRVLGSNSGATLLTPITTLTPGTGADERDPDCATEDGSRFFVVYEALGLGIAGRPATYSAAAGTLAVGAESALAIPTPPSFPPNSTAAVGEPAVDWAAARYLVAYRNLVHRPAFAGNPDTTVRSVRLLEIGPASRAATATSSTPRPCAQPSAATGSARTGRRWSRGGDPAWPRPAFHRSPRSRMASVRVARRRSARADPWSTWHPPVVARARRASPVRR